MSEERKPFKDLLKLSKEEQNEHLEKLSLEQLFDSVFEGLDYVEGILDEIDDAALSQHAPSLDVYKGLLKKLSDM